jgi:holliday junction DNA helicase RuvA
MIGRLRGLVAEVTEEEALIDVAGVGYLVRCGSRTLGHLPPLGEETVLHIESQWAEATGLRLYGFLGRDERRAFVMLQAIQGVGPKAALAVLDILAPAELAAAAAREDKAAVARANGVGPKLALRIVTELKGKPIADGPVSSFQAHGVMSQPATTPAVSAAGEAVAALMGLGVAEVNARRVVEAATLKLGEEAEIPVLIKAALQELGR